MIFTKLQDLLNAIRILVNDDVQIDTKNIQKGEATLTAISIGNGEIRPIVYMEHYNDLFNERGYYAVAMAMIEACENATIKAKEELNININNFSIWEHVKDNLILCIAPANTNNGYITNPYLDLELYVRVNLGDGTCKVNEQMLKMWNKTKEEVFITAMNKQGYIIKSMFDTISELLNSDNNFDDMSDIIENSIFDTGQKVITNKEKSFGASVLYHKDILSNVANQYGKDIYIIPSSIHEVIVTPINHSVTKEDMNQMIKEVNETEVSPEERLSNHVYIFRKDTMNIEW